MPLAHRYYQAREALSARLGRNRLRLVAAMIYTDDLLAMCVGIDRLVRFLTHWTVTVDALGIRAARIAPREVAAVGGQRALELVLGDAYPAAAPIDTFADVRFVPSLEPPATPQRGARARRAASADIAPPPARRVSRRNPPMPHAGVRIGEAQQPGPPKGAAPLVAVDDLDSESSLPIWGPGTVIA
jgi:hypothetical protein